MNNSENGKKYITWPTYVTMGLTSIGILVGAIGGVAYSSSERDSKLLEKARDNAVNIATLQECAKNTTEKLSNIDRKIDILIMRNKYEPKMSNS